MICGVQIKNREQLILLGMREYNLMDEQLSSNYSKVFVLVVRRVTILIHLFLLRVLIKIGMVSIRTVDLDAS